MRPGWRWVLLTGAGLLSTAGDVSGQSELPPIIDMHVHAMPARSFGPPPVPICAPTATFTPHDPRDAIGLAATYDCPQRIPSALSNDAQRDETLAIMERYNIRGVVAAGSATTIRRWSAAAPGRVIGAVSAVNVDSIRKWAAEGTIGVLAEFGFQYSGSSLLDSIPDRYFGIAEQLDLPLGIHVGPGPPGAPYLGTPKYRMALSNPLLLEDVLLRHPRLRLYVMHAGWPMGDQMIGLLYAHPQVYVDVGVIDWFIPRQEFYAYLKRLIDAGFEKRIMFGSDQMIWPQAIPAAIDAIQSAPFLSPAQKRDILYNNAARFLRLGD